MTSFEKMSSLIYSYWHAFPEHVPPPDLRLRLSVTRQANTRPADPERQFGSKPESDDNN
jgi:hypothetical protein